MTKHTFSDILPPSLLERADSLESIGINEYVWNWRDALLVINLLANNRVLVLAGDVYSKIKDELQPTYDNWYVKRNRLLPTDYDLQYAQTFSSDYIKAYVEKNGENYYFTIVPDF